MFQLSFNEFLYYGFTIVVLAVYLPLYIKRRHEIIKERRTSARWSIVLSFAVIGVIGVLAKLIDWPSALIASVISCAIAYYVVFIKYK